MINFLIDEYSAIDFSETLKISSPIRNYLTKYEREIALAKAPAIENPLMKTPDVCQNDPGLRKSFMMNISTERLKDTAGKEKCMKNGGS